MAEVIGLGSGIITLAGLALKVFQLSYDHLQKVRDVPESVSQYLQEILALKSALLRVQEISTLPGFASTLSSNERQLQNRSKVKSRWAFRSKVRDLTWPFQEKETMEMVEKLGRWNNIFTSFVSSYNLQVSVAVLNATQTHQQVSKRAVILDWIYSDSSAVSNEVIFSNHCESTCSWILTDWGFEAWLKEDTDGERKNLFCAGNPGVGKTTVMSFLINHLVSTSSLGACVLYHYFDFRAEAHNHQSGTVVRHLLRQLLEREDQLPQQVLTLYERSIKSGVELTEMIWTETLVTCMPLSSKSYVMLDGLDECLDQRGLSRLLHRLMRAGTKLCVTGRASSYESLSLHFGHYILIKAPKSDLVAYIESYVEDDKDLRAILTDSLARDVIFQLTDYADGVFLLVKLALRHLSGATTARQIRESLSNLPQNLRSAHQVTFERIQSAPAEKRDLALKALAWTILAKRPLTMVELLQALAFDLDDNEMDAENITTPATIVRVCFGFLEHRKDDDLVQISHASVVQYLESAECDEAFENSGLMIARSCVTYLSQSAFTSEVCRNSTELNTRFSAYPLLRYAALYWGEHVSEFQIKLVMEVERFLSTKNAILNAAQTFHYLRRARGLSSDAMFRELPQGFEKTHLLALWGLSEIATLQPLSYNEVVAPDSLGWEPLHWAAARGHPGMIEFLLSRGANTEIKDLRGWTPLFWAIHWGRVTALRCLLSNGASSHAKDKDGNTPLHLAVERGDEDVCRELLDRNLDWSVSSARGKSAFEEGLDSIVPEIAGMFLAREQMSGTRIEEDGTIEETALERALAWPPSVRSRIFQATLAREVVAAQSTAWHRPLLPKLQLYIGKLREKDRYRLTDVGDTLSFGFAEDLINQQNYEAGVLGYAILTEHVDLVKALIDAGVDLQKDWLRKFMRIEYIQFPVLLAAFVGNASLINLLIHHGAGVDVADYEGRGPLHYAAILGHVDAAQILSSHQSLLNSTDKMGKSPLHLVWSNLLRSTPGAIPRPQLENSLIIAELLAQNKADIDLADRFGCTPLHDAVRTGRLEVVRKLLQLGANVNIRSSKAPDPSARLEFSRKMLPVFGPDNDTPFTLACRSQKWDLACAIHDAGAVLPQDMNLRSPLVKVVADGNLSALQILFKFAPAAQVAGSGAGSNIPLLIIAVRALQWVMDKPSQHESDFRRPLVVPQNRHAVDAPERYRSVIELLLTEQQDPNVGDEHGSTALLEALEYSYNDRIVDLLLMYGGDTNSITNEGRNALHVAAASGLSPFVELMISHNVDVNHVSKNGDTPLSLAAANGHDEVVSLLLKQPNIDEPARDKQDWLQLSRCYNAVKSGDLSRFCASVPKTLPADFFDRKGQSLLHIAADQGVPEIISTVLNLNIDVNAQDVRGDTALHAAAKSRNPNVAVINALVNGGADIQIRNFEGETATINRVPQNGTALHLAAYAGSVEIVQSLLDHARKTSSQHKQSRALGRNPSHDGGYNDIEMEAQIACPLIEWRSDQCGRTALMCAVESGSVPTVRYLLEAGADVNASGGRGSWGFNALDLAPSAARHHNVQEHDAETTTTKTAEKSEIITLLESYGAVEFEW